MNDGLTPAERKAYEKCRPLSCIHERCYKRYMFSSPKKQKLKCGKLLDDWKACYASEIAAATAGDSAAANAAATKAAQAAQAKVDQELASAKSRMCSVK